MSITNYILYGTRKLLLLLIPVLFYDDDEQKECRQQKCLCNKYSGINSIVIAQTHLNLSDVYVTHLKIIILYLLYAYNS